LQYSHLNSYLFFFHAPATTTIYTLSLHDALPISRNLVLEVLLVVALEVGPPGLRAVGKVFEIEIGDPGAEDPARDHRDRAAELRDRKSTRLNSSHLVISYAVFCLKKKKKNKIYSRSRLDDENSNNFVIIIHRTVSRMKSAYVDA